MNQLLIEDSWSLLFVNSLWVEAILKTELLLLFLHSVETQTNPFYNIYILVVKFY